MILRVRPFDDSHSASQNSRSFDRKYKGSNNWRKKDATELYEYNEDWLPGGSVGKNRPLVLGTQAPSLAQEDPTGRGATEPVCHNP